MLVHSFSESLEHFDDYSNFASQYQVDVIPNRIQQAADLNGINFYLGWVIGEPKYLEK